MYKWIHCHADNCTLVYKNKLLFFVIFKYWRNVPHCFMRSYFTITVNYYLDQTYQHMATETHIEYLDLFLVVVKMICWDFL